MAGANLHEHPSSFPPMPAVARVLAAFDRQKLEGFITVAIGLLDVLDGDTEAEDATGADDAFEDHNERFGYDGPGCPIADPGGGNVEDEGEDVDDREPDHDAENETWSHPDDHPAELFVRAGGLSSSSECIGDRRQ